MKFEGAFTAMITPFIGDHLDEEGLVRNIKKQIEAGITGLVFLGTTGEDVTLAEEEQMRVMEIGIRETKGKALVIIGTGSNSTKKTIEKTKKAQAMGADAALVVTPYYNRPTQEGIFRHFESISKQTDLPLLPYNILSRTGTNIETSTLLRIAGLRNVVGVKEASGNIVQMGDVIKTIKKQYPAFSVLSGDDVLTLPLMALGGSGIISVASNLLPERVVALVNACLQDRFREARAIHEELLPLVKTLFIEVNPIPIKQAMQFCGFPSGNCRLPLCEMRPDNQKILENLLVEMRLA